MGRSGGRSGGMSGGGRSGGSRSSGRSAMGSSASRSFSSSSTRSMGSSYRGISSSPKGGRPMSGYTPHKSMGGYEPRKTIRQPIHTGSYRGGFGGGVYSGGSIFGNGNIFVNMDTNPTPVFTNTVQPTNAHQPIPQQTNTSQATAQKKNGSGCLTKLIIFIVMVVIINSLISAFSGSSSSGYITKSTRNRNKIHAWVSDEAGYYTDECGWIRNSTELTNGLKDFYDSTGILPYVYIIDNVAGDYDPSTEKLVQFAEEQYNALFKDDGHALLVFWDFAGAYEYTLWLGEDTLEVMDTEACDILFDYLDYYYYYADTEEAFFADAFSDAGEHMMKVTRSSGYYLMYVLVGVGAGYAIYYFVKKRKEKETERKRRAEEILNAPLEKFGTNGDVIDDLEKKYEKEI